MRAARGWPRRGGGLGRRGRPRPRPVKRRHRRGGGGTAGWAGRDGTLGSALPAGELCLSLPARGDTLEGLWALGAAAAVLGEGSPR